MEWKISRNLVPYEEAVAAMEERVAAIRESTAEELVWLLEHPPLYTAGTSAKDGDLLDPRFPVFKTGRGGEYTYHGPGQRVAYVMMDLRRYQKTPDIRKYVSDLEEWIIRTLEGFDINGERRNGRVGIWVNKTLSLSGVRPPLLLPSGRGIKGEGETQEAKIAAIGVRVRHWVAYHGIAINLNPDLSHYGGIVPCGIAEYGVTSMKELGADIPLNRLDEALRQKWAEVFEPQKEAA